MTSKLYSECEYTITFEVYCDATRNWRRENSMRDKSYFGCDLYSLYFTDNTEKFVGVPSEEVVQRFNMLAGPYWEAVLKAWEIKNDR